MGIGIRCCKSCIAPKRHLGCHATCKEYLDEKAQFEKDKAKVKEEMENIPNLRLKYDLNNRMPRHRRK
jgi:hypothetical protein